MDISVVMSTYNRAGVLGQAIESLLAQDEDSPSYEIVIVDNNSTDNTKQVVESYMQRSSRVRYIFEAQQGLAYGRNAGIENSQGEFICFTDDDVIVSSNWVRQMYTALLRYPEADFIGGTVLARWAVPPPKWIDYKMAPLACQDLGDKPFKVSIDRPRCMIGANLGVRRRAFERAGLFDPTTQRVGDGIGSTEDYDWQLCIWQRGGHGMYVPEVKCAAYVAEDRMVKSYHRRWHFGHGKFNAISRRPDFEGGSFRLFDVPAFMYRQLLQTLLKYCSSVVRRRSSEAFDHETAVLFYVGFIRQRWQSYFAKRTVKTLPARST